MKKNILILASSIVLLACQKKEEHLSSQVIETTNHQSLTTLALSENHFNFGKIKKGEKVEHTYEVTNTGETPLIISEVRPGCGCTAPDFTREPILPGEKGKIVLAFDSTNFEGLVNKEAGVFANVDQNPIILTFSAEVEP